MNPRNILLIFAGILVLSLLTACEEWNPADSNDESSSGTGDVTGSDITVDDVLAQNCADHDDAGDYTWNSSNAVEIEFTGEAVNVIGSGVAVNSSVVTITSAGTYVLTGSFTNGQVIVDTEDEANVYLVLSGVSITCTSSAPLYIKNTEKTIIVLDENTENTLIDGSSYDFEDPEDPEPNATIYSKDDLTIYGAGSLAVTGNYQDGITSKDGLIIAGGSISITAVDDGIRGKDYLVVKDGTVSVTSSGDGMKSDNEDDETKGYVYICGGDLDIVSGGDGINATTDLLVDGGTITVKSGGGSNVQPGSVSTKGLKAGIQLVIDAGALSVNASDDALHSNGTFSLNGGSHNLASNDDGIHSDAALGINGGTLTITKSYEGIESNSVVVINGGTIHLVSSDDGINVASGNGGDDFGGPGGGGESGNFFLYINGGYIVVNAAGDGIDCNGSIVMTDGTVIVNGPVSNNNAALDHSTFKITGGSIVAVGSSGMAQAPSTSSTQYSVMLNSRGTLRAGVMFHIQTSDGDGVLSFEPAKNYQSVVFSSAALQKGTTYDVYYSGTSTGAGNDGLYTGGSYTPGTQIGSFTISSIVTR